MCLLLIITLLLVGCGRGSSEDSITIGGRNLRAGDLVHILEQLIEARTDIDVVNQADLGATDVLHQGNLDKDWVCMLSIPEQLI